VKIRESLPLLHFSALLAGAIILTWCLVAFALDQSLFATQKSGLLMTVGAADGQILDSGEWWRIVTSQFLHVHFLHMLFNAGCIAVVGSFIEQRCGWWMVALVCVVGGSVGQIASVLSYPELVSSGASQALMALCGASLVMLAERRPRLFVLAVVAIQAALDIYVAHKVKAGHNFGFLGGLLVGAALLLFGGSRSVQSKPNKPMQPTCDDARGRSSLGGI
jgi:rhomboid protease GluP